MNTITRKDLRPFPRPVQDMVIAAVNEHDVPYRVVKSGHLLMLTGDRGTDVAPLKLSHDRPAEESVKFFDRWLRKNFPSWVEKDLHDDDGNQVTPAGYPEEVEALDSPPAETESGEPLTAVETAYGKGWVAQNWDFVTDGKTWKCIHCDFERPDRQGLHLHNGRHTGEASKRSAIGRAARQKKATKKAQPLPSGAVQAVQAFAAELGYRMVPATEEDPTEELERLRSENTSLQEKLDEANARIALAKEALEA